ncbi:hypothetical protein KC324_g17176, partial [Hortaea werneckii]
MPQSSLTAWLNKPATVKTPPVTTPRQDEKPSAPTQTGEAGNTQHPTPPSQELKTKSTSTTASSAIHPEHNSSKTLSSFQTPLPPLPPNIHLRACTKADIPALKRLNALLLPIPYPETFYREILQDEVTNNLTLLALWHDDPSRKDQEKGILVGAVRGRLLPSSSTSSTSTTRGPTTTLPTPTTTGTTPTAPKEGEKEEKLLYLSTLVLLSPYRQHGIMTHMLRHLTQRAIREYRVSSVGAHVWEANTEGLG